MKKFIYISLLGCLVSPKTQAASMSKMLSVPGFQAVVIATFNLNRAMQEAAKDPANPRARQRVRQAYPLLKTSLMMLASDFKSNKLVDNDLPGVLQALGGFVDKSIQSRMEAFLKDPSPASIPQIGNTFPQSFAASQSGNSGSSSSGNGTAQFEKVYVLDNARDPGNLSTVNGQAVNFGSSDLAQQIADLSVSNGNSSQEVQSKTSSTPTRDLSSEIKEIQQNNLQETLRGLETPSIELKTQKKADGALYVPGSFPALALVNLFFLRTAHAEEGGQSGSKAAEILFGIAAIMGAIAPAIAAAIEASEQTKQEQIKADAKKEMAQMAADVANRQTEAQLSINSDNNGTIKEGSKLKEEYALKKKQLEVSTLNDASEKAFALKQEQLRQEQQMNEEKNKIYEQQIAIARVAEENNQRARLTALGFSNSPDGSNSNSLALSSAVASANSGLTNGGSAFGSQAGGSQQGITAARGIASDSASNSASGLTAAASNSNSGNSSNVPVMARGITAGQNGILGDSTQVASDSANANTTTEEADKNSKRTKKGIKRGIALRGLVAGSTPTNKVKVSPEELLARSLSAGQ